MDPRGVVKQRLADEVPFSSLTVAEQAESTDGTVKTLFHTADGRPVEAVLMRYRDPPADAGAGGGAPTSVTWGPRPGGLHSELRGPGP